MENADNPEIIYSAIPKAMAASKTLARESVAKSTEIGALPSMRECLATIRSLAE